MCGNPSPNNSAIQEQQQREAEDARRREDERNARIEQGITGIRSAFSRYDDTYFDGLRKAFISQNQDTLQQNQNNEAEQANYARARVGLNNSSAGNTERAKLASGFATQNAALEGGADDFTRTQRDRLFDAQQTQEAQVRASADATGAANAATTAAGNIARTPMPMSGDWMAPVLTAGIGAKNAYDTGQDTGYYRGRSAQLFPSRSSQRSVGG